jgi:hypothetical protein
MPGEDGNYGIDASRYPQLLKWRQDRRDVLVKGTFDYRVGPRAFVSHFVATLWFSDSSGTAAATPVRVNWRNTDAT